MANCNRGETIAYCDGIYVRCQTRRKKEDTVNLTEISLLLKKKLFGSKCLPLD